jgi:hypothetical protein
MSFSYDAFLSIFRTKLSGIKSLCTELPVAFFNLMFTGPPFSKYYTVYGALRFIRVGLDWSKMKTVKSKQFKCVQKNYRNALEPLA